MWRNLEPVIDSLFVGPVWPATVLVLLVVCYLLASLVSSIEIGDFDISFQNEGWESVGAGTLRWFHLGPVPIVVWVGCFSFIHWLIAFGTWHFYESASYQPTILDSMLLAGRNAVISALVTKMVTGPLVPYFAGTTGFSEETIIGQPCVISSSEATPTHGQAKHATGGAPLLLNVRTDGETLTKGTIATVIAYDAERRLYTVTSDPSSTVATPSETQP